MWRPALEAVLADADGAWLVRLIAQGYYAGESATWGDGGVAGGCGWELEPVRRPS